MNVKQTKKSEAASSPIATAKTSSAGKATNATAHSAKPEKLKKVKPPKDVKCTFTLPEPEYDAIQDLRATLSEALGHKVKKAQLLRVASRILLNQTPAKVKAELAKLQNSE